MFLKRIHQYRKNFSRIGYCRGSLEFRSKVNDSVREASPAYPVFEFELDQNDNVFVSKLASTFSLTYTRAKSYCAGHISTIFSVYTTKGLLSVFPQIAPDDKTHYKTQHITDLFKTSLFVHGSFCLMKKVKTRLNIHINIWKYHVNMGFQNPYDNKNQNQPIILKTIK